MLIAPASLIKLLPGAVRAQKRQTCQDEPGGAAGCRLPIYLCCTFPRSSIMSGGPLAALTAKSWAMTVYLLIVIPFSALICTLVNAIDVIGLSGRPTMNPAFFAPVALRFVMLMS